ncbi:MAG TPA: hypothetical protein VMR95_03490 [Candidatus Binatia bacterium]|nr:hypothetical protein [Candidatus Binatia bacterium]
MVNNHHYPILPQTYRGEALEKDMNRSWRRNYNLEQLLQDFREQLTQHTIFMAEHGVSHRKNPLQVGAVIVGQVALPSYNPNRQTKTQSHTDIKVFEGYNTSPFKGASKDCAELRATAMGDEVVVGPGIERGRFKLFHNPLRPWINLDLSIASNGGPNINHEVNGLEAPTLHCCTTPCQHVLEWHPSTSPELGITSIAFDGTTREIIEEEHLTLGGLRALYEGVQSPVVSHDLDLQPGARH